MNRTKQHGGKVTQHNPGQGPEVTTIHVEPPQAIYGVLRYLAVLAYPRGSDSQKREKFMEALDAWRCKCCKQQIGRSKGSVRVRTLHGTISKGFRSLERRLTAGSMAWAICVNGARIPYEWLGIPSQENGGKGVILRGPGTINEAAKAILKLKGNTLDEEQTANVKHRIWAESLPVLHFAIALYQRVESLQLDVADEDKLLALLLCPDWLLRDWLLQTLIYAESLRTFLPSRIPTFQQDMAVRLLPA